MVEPMLRHWLLLGVLCVGVHATQAGSKPKYDRKGNWLITDRLNNRIVEVEPLTGTVVWEYEVSISKTETNWLVGPRDANRFKGKTMIVASGLPPGVSPDYPDGYEDSRVFEVTKKGKIRWQYGQTGVTGAGYNQLNNPASALYMPSKKMLIADQGNHRVIRLRRKGKDFELDWQYGISGVSGSGPGQLNSPACVQRRGNGNYIIADTGNHRIIEVNTKGELVWQYGDPADTTILNYPTYVCRLSGDNFLITDSGNSRVLLMERDGTILFAYTTTNLPGSVAEPQPLRALQLRKTGNILITDQLNHQVIEVDQWGNIINQYGAIGVPGQEPGYLNTPADAKVVDDFTGLTAPKSGGGGGFDFSPF